MVCQMVLNSLDVVDSGWTIMVTKFRGVRNGRWLKAEGIPIFTTDGSY